MTFIADEPVYEPVILALKAVKFDVVRKKDITVARPDLSVMQACLAVKGILNTLDMGIP